MARVRIPQTLRGEVAARADYRCGYCRTPQAYTAMPMHIEHIVPLAVGGSSTEDNLWLACPLCNGSKGTQTSGVDPESGAEVSLFNPRLQTWAEHFRWSADGVLIVGRTAQGRATIVALKLNNAHLMAARRRWVLAGWHPPADGGLPIREG